jgi:hypothetical protein
MLQGEATGNMCLGKSTSPLLRIEKGVLCVSFSTLNLQNFAVDLSFFLPLPPQAWHATVTPRAKTHIQTRLNSKRRRARSYSASPMEASGFVVVAKAPLCPFCHGKKVPSWSLRELLQHSNGKSRRGEGISGPEHSALAKYILSRAGYRAHRSFF